MTGADLVMVRSFMAERYRRLLRAVARQTGIDERAILSTCRTREVTRARHIAMYLAHVLWSPSYADVARAFGRDDHTTAMHAIRTIAAKIAVDVDLAEVVRILKARMVDDAADDGHDAIDSMTPVVDAPVGQGPFQVTVPPGEACTLRLRNEGTGRVVVVVTLAKLGERSG
jgi:hypothetical protein